VSAFPRGVLDRLAGRRPRRLDDRGAVAVIVAILLAGGVLLGFLALTIDVGELYLERQQLQSGADSAALAIANACAKNTADCANGGAIASLAKKYANANSADGVSHVAEVCGHVPGGLLGTCSDPVGNLTDCIGDPPADGSPFVEVRLSTEMPDGTFVLPPVFAQTLAGNSGYTGTSVGACARAGWSTSLNVLGMTVSTCEFNVDTQNGTNFGSPTDPTDELEIGFWEDAFNTVQQNDKHPCPSAMEEPPHRPGGETDPGVGQAAILTGDDHCLVDIPSDGNVVGFYPPIVQYQPLDNDCEARVRAAVNGRDIIYIPIYNAATNTPNGTVFTIVGLAPFVVTGFEFGPPPGDPIANSLQFHNYISILTGLEPCKVNFHRCLAGVFTGPIIPLDNAAPGNVSVVKLIG
jgi:Flp pilus assembly protein TadG